MIQIMLMIDDDDDNDDDSGENEEENGDDVRGLSTNRLQGCRKFCLQDTDSSATSEGWNVACTIPFGRLMQPVWSVCNTCDVNEG